MKKLTKDLTTLNTKRLLSLYRSFRESFSKFIRSYYCPCCGMRYADVYGKLYSEEERKMIHKEVSDYEKLFEKTEWYVNIFSIGKVVNVYMGQGDIVLW